MPMYPFDQELRNQWFDLSGAELRARLKQRGMDPFNVAIFLHYRENEHFARQIDQILA